MYEYEYEYEYLSLAPSVNHIAELLLVYVAMCITPIFDILDS